MLPMSDRESRLTGRNIRANSQVPKVNMNIKNKASHGEASLIRSLRQLRAASLVATPTTPIYDEPNARTRPRYMSPNYATPATRTQRTTEPYRMAIMIQPRPGDLSLRARTGEDCITSPHVPANMSNKINATTRRRERRRTQT